MQSYLYSTGRLLIGMNFVCTLKRFLNHLVSMLKRSWSRGCLQKIYKIWWNTNKCGSTNGITQQEENMTDNTYAVA